MRIRPPIFAGCRRIMDSWSNRSSRRYSARRAATTWSVTSSFCAPPDGAGDHRIMAGGEFHERAHWLALAPGLHIEDRALLENVAHLELSPGQAARFAHAWYLQGRAEWGCDATF